VSTSSANRQPWSVQPTSITTAPFPPVQLRKALGCTWVGTFGDPVVGPDRDEHRGPGDFAVLERATADDSVAIRVVGYADLLQANTLGADAISEPVRRAVRRGEPTALRIVPRARCAWRGQTASDSETDG
jgi:hypothetical protein